MKTGRNEPCPCGSGKKYKKCCLMKDQPVTLTRPRIHKTCDELIPELLHFAQRTCDPDVVDMAWEAFSDGEMEEEPEESPYYPFFLRWCLFLYIPDEYCPEVDDDFDFPSPETIGARYLSENRSRMDSFSIKCLEAALEHPLTFWQVEAVELDKGLLLKDLFTGREIHVEEILGTHHLNRWDILFGNIMEVHGTCVFNMMAPYSLPSRSRELIMLMVKELELPDPEGAIDPLELFEVDIELIDFYVDFVEDLSHGPLPALQNMDGEPFAFMKSLYTFDPSQREAVLRRLSEAEGFGELHDMSAAKSELIWLEAPMEEGPLKDVTKGRIEIGKKFLETECNSKERDNRLRKRLTDLLPGILFHQKTTNQPLDLDKMRPDSPPLAKGKVNNTLDVNQLPDDVRAAMKEQFDQMHLGWADTAIPLLNGQTPREAIRRPEAKGQVISLINDWENMQSRMENPQFTFDFNRLRQELGLPPE